MAEGTSIEKILATDGPIGKTVELLFIITVNYLCAITKPTVSDDFPRQADLGCIKMGR